LLRLQFGQIEAVMRAVIEAFGEKTAEPVDI